MHNYDPYFYAQQIPPTVTHWGSTTDIKALNDWMDAIEKWSETKGLPVYYGRTIAIKVTIATCVPTVIL